MKQRLLFRASLRHLGGHPWLTALSLLGIALGVAVVVSIDLANASALRAFERSTDTVTGRATHQLVGGPSGVPETVYRDLRLLPGAPVSAPMVEGSVRARSGDQRPLTVLGVDPFAEGPFRSYVPQGGGQVDMGTFLTEPGAALLTERTARALEVKAGDALRVAVEGVEKRLRVLAVLTPGDEGSARAMEGLVVTDIATAQELFDQEGRLSRIDLRLPEGAQAEASLERLRPLLPEGVEVVRPRARGNAVAQMTRAFRTNLTALSLLALVVGTFLIYNTMTFSVVQRREQLGRLRALGVTRNELFALVLGEAGVLGAVGTVAGVLLGILLGRGLVELVTRTINDLYLSVSVRGLALEPFTLGKGLVLGLGATLAAALRPAWEAARSAPALTLRRSTLEDVAHGRAPRLALTGVAVLAAGVGLLALPTRELLPAYAGLFSVLLGASLLVPWLTALLAQGAAGPLGGAFGLLGRMAARGVTASLSRTAVALAALMVAVATTVGVGLMVTSFRGTVADWLGSSLVADIYVSPPSLVARRGGAAFQPGLAERVRTTPGVASSSTMRTAQVRVDGVPTDVRAVDFGETPTRPYRFKEGDAARVWKELEAADTVLVSEPFASHRGVGLGSRVELATDGGPASFRVVGVYFDYGSDAGTVMMPRSTWLHHFRDETVSGVALYAAPEQDVDALVARVRERVGTEQMLDIRSNRTLRETSLEVFDRTFTITHVLRLLAIGVAFVGVLSALMALQLERAREFAVLRATGLTPRQLWALVSLQTGLLGALAGLFSLPLGVALAYVLVHVINQRSFGWTLQLVVAPPVLFQALGLALLAAALAGLYPSWKMSRANPARALREE
ncbi:FtsX-like permease family protein [Cystobacter ferrugineus]|uniref:Permease n=1 Tax=Cystobacter ferrugineus TaxID=83449 RepID=A0A1L9BJ04_9BACT|nr:ABC transporter permease [Cystobacter ferrugineus]OJH42219.1 permease [Cystobacter ferrugineus]